MISLLSLCETVGVTGSWFRFSELGETFYHPLSLCEIIWRRSLRANWRTFPNRNKDDGAGKGNWRSRGLQNRWAVKATAARFDS